MPRRTILTDRQRSALFDLPVDEPSLRKHYTLADDDLQVRATNATGTGDWSESGEGKTKILQTGDQIYYFPHLAVGASWQTTITYINSLLSG